MPYSYLHKTIDNLINTDFETLSQINDIGPTMANSIIEFFNQEQTIGNWGTEVQSGSFFMVILLECDLGKLSKLIGPQVAFL